MNIKLGLFRLWLVAAVAWIAATTYEAGHNLCASIRVAEEQSQSAEVLFKLMKFEPNPFDPDQYRIVVDCFPSAPNISVAWNIRRQSVAYILGVPLGALILGCALLWAFGGFAKDRSKGLKGN